MSLKSMEDRMAEPESDHSELIWRSAKQSLEHQMFRLHLFNPKACDGCANAEEFIATTPADWREALGHRGPVSR